MSACCHCQRKQWELTLFPMAEYATQAKEEVEAPDYSDKEIAFLGVLRKKLTSSKVARDNTHREFDDMGYIAHYNSNMDYDLAYNRPRRNRIDDRLTTGYTGEKTLTMLSILLQYNFTPNITPYDISSGTFVEKLGVQMENFVKKSRDDEEPGYDYKRALIYQEALRQGDAFPQDTIFEKWELRKTFKKELDWSEDLMKAEWEEELVLVWKRLNTQLISGLNFYPGNIRTFWMDAQPYIFCARIVPIGEAEAIFGKWSRWKNVPKSGIKKFGETMDDISQPYHDWTLHELEEGMVEIIQYQAAGKENCYQILVNGVMMLPINFPLSALTGKNKYTVVKLSMQPISEYFFYSKSIPAKTKADQQMLDQMLRLMLLKNEQSATPPYLNLTGQSVDRRVFYPAMITKGISRDEFQPLLDNPGVTQAEIGMFEIMKKLMDEKSISPTMQGQSIKGNQTAKEIMELQKQSIVKLGLIILGVIQFEKDLCKLRILNIIKYWTEPDSQIFNSTTGKLEGKGRRFEMEATLPSGQKGLKIFEMDDERARMMASGELGQEQIDAEAATISRLRKKSVQIVILSPSELRALDLLWEVDIQPVENDSDALERSQFYQGLTAVWPLLGQEFNREWLKKEIAKHEKWDADQAFTEQSLQLPSGMQGTAPPTAPRGQAPQQPSINTLVR